MKHLRLFFQCVVMIALVIIGWKWLSDQRAATIPKHIVFLGGRLEAVHAFEKELLSTSGHLEPSDLLSHLEKYGYLNVRPLRLNGKLFWLASVRTGQDSLPSNRLDQEVSIDSFAGSPTGLAKTLARQGRLNDGAVFCVFPHRPHHDVTSKVIVSNFRGAMCEALALGVPDGYPLCSLWANVDSGHLEVSHLGHVKADLKLIARLTRAEMVAEGTLLPAAVAKDIVSFVSKQVEAALTSKRDEEQ